MSRRSPRHRVPGQGEFPCTIVTDRVSPSGMAGQTFPASPRITTPPDTAARTFQDRRRRSTSTTTAATAASRTPQPVAPIHWADGRRGVAPAMTPIDPQGKPPKGHRTRRNSASAAAPAVASTNVQGAASR